MVSPKKNWWFSSLITRVSFRGSFLSKNRRIQDDHYLLMTKNVLHLGCIKQRFPNKITLTKLANCKSVFVIFVKPFREHWLWKVFFNEPALQEPKNLGPALEEYEEPWRERFIRTLKEAGLIKGYWWIFCWKNLLNKALLPGCMAFKFPIEYQGRVETSWAKSCSNWWRCNFLSTWHSLLCWL